MSVIERKNQRSAGKFAIYQCPFVLSDLNQRRLPLLVVGHLFLLAGDGCWFSIVGCWLLVVDSWLLVVGSWFLVVCNWVLVASCWL